MTYTGKSKLNIRSPQDTSIPFLRIVFVWILLLTSKCSTCNSSQINNNWNELSCLWKTIIQITFLSFISYLWNQTALVFLTNRTPVNLYDSNAITQHSDFFREVVKYTSWSLNTSQYSDIKIALYVFHCPAFHIKAGELTLAGNSLTSGVQ